MSTNRSIGRTKLPIVLDIITGILRFMGDRALASLTDTLGYLAWRIVAFS
ncbi:MAG: hypothetical protein KME05_06620 [Gloeocapsa sp. UFS-A4-WI-NPMV-4B04]|nr:hypothetical protein [Gloeocapsa sp. UFS-A4-WI-NPMV-4B04]